MFCVNEDAKEPACYSGGKLTEAYT